MDYSSQRLKPLKTLLAIAAAIAISVLAMQAISQPGLRAPTGDTGIVVTYVSTMKGVSISVKSARLPNAKDFPNAGSFGYAKNPLAGGGATEGASLDSRRLPEWIDFEWSEPPSPEDPNQSLEEYRALPRERQRVFIRDRISHDVINEVIESNQRKLPGKLSDKALWIYFVWTKEGIKMHWQLWYRPEVGAPSFPREGGDTIVPDV